MEDLYYPRLRPADRVAAAAQRYAAALLAAEHPYTIEVSQARRSLTAAIRDWEVGPPAPSPSGDAPPAEDIRDIRAGDVYRAAGGVWERVTSDR